MNIKLIAIGKTDDANLQQLIDRYLKRLSHYVKFELELLPDIKNSKHLSEAEQKKKKANCSWPNCKQPIFCGCSTKTGNHLAV